MSRYSDGPEGWIGVDLDRTLCVRQHDSCTKDNFNDRGIGEPVPAMVERVKQWLAEGRRVKIFTARVAGLFEHETRNLYITTGDQVDTAETQVQKIKAWCKEVFGRELEVTAVKDSYCKEIWDDIAVTVEENTGRQLSNSKVEGPAPNMCCGVRQSGQLLQISEAMQNGGFIG